MRVNNWPNPEWGTFYIRNEHISLANQWTGKKGAYVGSLQDKKKKGLKDVTAKCSGLFIPDPDLNKQL